VTLSSHTTSTLRVALYARFSGELQNPQSARDQLRKCDERAAAEGWQVIERFADEAMSGTIRQRPAYQALRHAIVDQKVDFIVAESLDRFSRDQEETANLFNLCRFNEVDIFTLSEGKISELHIGFSSTINAVFLRQLGEKVRRGLQSRVSDGRSAGGKAYGYRVRLLPNGLADKGHFEIVEEEAAAVRRIMEAYARGESPKRIALALNEDRVPSPSGGKREFRGTFCC